MTKVNFGGGVMAWDIPKIAVCTDTSCTCYSLKSHIRRADKLHPDQKYDSFMVRHVIS